MGLPDGAKRRSDGASGHESLRGNHAREGYDCCVTNLLYKGHPEFDPSYYVVYNCASSRPCQSAANSERLPVTVHANLLVPCTIDRRVAMLRTNGKG